MNPTGASPKTMPLEELWAVLAAHSLWVNGEKGGRRADLSRLRLEGAQLRGVNLTKAKLVGAKIINCDLAGARLVTGTYTDRAAMAELLADVRAEPPASRQKAAFYAH